MAETAVMAPAADSTAPAAQLARVWLTALTVSGDDRPTEPASTPMDDVASAQAFLTTQSATLVTIVLSDPFRPRQAAAVGRALVKADWVGADVLGRSLRVLILRLPELLRRCALSGATAVGGLDGRVAEVTEALANGYVRALRDRTLEQESIIRAELDAQRIISDQLRHQATHDPLTGLANRAAVLGRLAAALAPGRGTSAGLCYLDLDGFKAVNDRYGHEAGDELLVTVARRIGETARRYGALAGRLGGDEFVVVAEISPGIGGMVALAASILGEVSHPVKLRAGLVRVSACAGIAECAAGSPASATLIADADAALYQAKSSGPGRWAVCDSARGTGRWQASLASRGGVTATACGQTYQAPCRAETQAAGFALERAP
jgi:diguanylate cyclase (GGDEF)-like protein